MDSNPPIEVTVPLRVEVWKTAFRAHARRHWRTKLYLICGPLIAWGGFVNLADALAGQSSDSAIMWSGLLLGMGVMATLSPWLLWPWQFARRFRQNPQYGADSHWSFAAEEFVLAVPGSQSTSRYECIVKTVEIPAGLLLYPQKNLFYWLPREAFHSPSDYQTVRERFGAVGGESLKSMQ